MDNDNWFLFIYLRCSFLFAITTRKGRRTTAFAARTLHGMHGTLYLFLQLRIGLFASFRCGCRGLSLGFLRRRITASSSFLLLLANGILLEFLGQEAFKGPLAMLLRCAAAAYWRRSLPVDNVAVGLLLHAFFS